MNTPTEQHAGRQDYTDEGNGESMRGAVLASTMAVDRLAMHYLYLHVMS